MEPAICLAGSKAGGGIRTESKTPRINKYCANLLGNKAGCTFLLQEITMCGRLDIRVIYLSLRRISCPVQLSVPLLLHLKSESKLSSAQDKYLSPLLTILSLQRPCSLGGTLRMIALSGKYFAGRAVCEAKASSSYCGWKQKGNSSLGPFCTPAEARAHSKCLCMRAEVWKESRQGRGVGRCWSLEALFVVGAACHGALCPPLQAACSKLAAQQSSCAGKLRSGLKVGDLPLWCFLHEAGNLGRIKGGQREIPKLSNSGIPAVRLQSPVLTSNKQVKGTPCENPFI